MSHFSDAIYDDYKKRLRDFIFKLFLTASDEDCKGTQKRRFKDDYVQRERNKCARLAIYKSDNEDEDEKMTPLLSNNKRQNVEHDKNETPSKRLKQLCESEIESSCGNLKCNVVL